MATSTTHPALVRASPFWTFLTHQCWLVFRGRHSVWSRLALVAIPAALMLLTGASDIGRRGFVGLGQLTFGALMLFNGYYALAQANVTSQAIAGEREQGTLDALRITGLSPLAILVGKGSSQWFRAMLLISQQLPLWAICLVLGGLSPGALVGAYLLLSAVLFLGCHAALLCSVSGRTSRTASQGTTGLLACFYVAPYLLSAIAAKGWLPPPSLVVADWLTSHNPISAYTGIMLTGQIPWASILLHFGFGAAFLALGAATFERACRREAKSSGEVPRPLQSVRPRRRPIPRVGAQPLAWKEYHFAAGGRKGLENRWLAYLLSWCAVALLMARASRTQVISVEDGGFAMCIMGVIGLAVEIPFAATRLFGLEVLHHTLSDLAVLPIPTSRLVVEKIRGYLPLLLPPASLLALGTTLAAGKIFREILPFANVLPVAYFASQFALLLVLTVHCSLLQTKGAFGIAFGVMALANFLLFSLLIGMLRLPPFLVLIPLGAAAVWFTIFLARIFPTHLAIAAAK